MTAQTADLGLAGPARRQRLFLPVCWLVITAAAAVVLYSAFNFPPAALEFRFLLLALLTLGVTSRISIKIPRFGSAVSVSDTLLFLTLILYGGEAAVLLGSAEGLASTARFCKQKVTVAYNAAAMAAATFIAYAALRLCFGAGLGFDGGFDGQFISAVGLMALVQYAANSGLIALAASLNANRPFWQTWHRQYLWTSITYFAGASAAGMIAALMRVFGTSALIVSTPIIFIVYFTYRTYMKNVETSAAQAEQARRHVEELSHYIAEQERIREQYAQIEKLSALGELASGVAHDFNNTLAGILGRAQLMMRTQDPEKIRRGLEVIIKSAEDGAKTVKRIQDFARQRRAHALEPLAVGQLLSDVSEMTRPRWKDRAEASGVHIALQLRTQSNAIVHGDGSELREVLVNMVFNAVDAMPDGGTLTLASSEEGGRVVLSVGDTGVGMTQEVRSRIFDPFFTTKGEAGLGLGLAVSYGIIRRHEGSIEVESRVGAGTTFRISLPAAQAAAPARAAKEHEKKGGGAQSPSDSLKVLVVDDEPTVRELLCEILEAEGHLVCPAAGGFEALTLFRGGGFDAVFTDIGMPGMSGWELAHAIRQEDDVVPIAVVTGWGEALGSGERKAARVDWVVTKPFTADRIAELAREAAARRAKRAAEGAGLTCAA
ncbi:MAG TPA: ATP-binding protein [Pyrinomonadaceae bacterium]|jgi:signal transduction histidine kinase/ActR/RegA family two-component response regulator|nr:ATP-binding protein [Pyrinomonadaceae bacterium]